MRFPRHIVAVSVRFSFVVVKMVQEVELSNVTLALFEWCYFHKVVKARLDVHEWEMWWVQRHVFAM